jgi:hypothetical protein
MWLQTGDFFRCLGRYIELPQEEEMSIGKHEYWLDIRACFLTVVSDSLYASTDDMKPTPHHQVIILLSAYQ